MRQAGRIPSVFSEESRKDYNWYRLDTANCRLYCTPYCRLYYTPFPALSAVSTAGQAESKTLPVSPINGESCILCKNNTNMLEMSGLHGVQNTGIGDCNGTPKNRDQEVATHTRQRA